MPLNGAHIQQKKSIDPEHCGSTEPPSPDLIVGVGDCQDGCTASILHISSFKVEGLQSLEAVVGREWSCGSFGPRFKPTASKLLLPTPPNSHSYMIRPLQWLLSLVGALQVEATPTRLSIIIGRYHVQEPDRPPLLRLLLYCRREPGRCAVLPGAGAMMTRIVALLAALPAVASFLPPSELGSHHALRYRSWYEGTSRNSLL